MNKFKVTYKRTPNAQKAKDPEEVKASGFADVGDWIEFTDGLGQVLRVRSESVHRIDRL